jgi:tetratricopeptide (TPR) repeat protein
MKKILTFIRAIFSLGGLGVVIALMALLVAFGVYSQNSVPFDAAVERMFVLGQLESQALIDLVEKQVQESLELFHLAYDLPPSGAAEEALQAQERVSATLAQLEADEHFLGDEEYYTTDLTESIAEFNQALSVHRQDFEDVLNSASSMEEEEILQDIENLETSNELLLTKLRAIIVSVEQDRQRALAAFPEDSNFNLAIIAMAMVATLLLALVGYQLIAATVRPISRLRNLITSIGGDSYRPGGPDVWGAGSLFNALEELARAEQTRNQASKQQIEDLRQQLYESRRRRLKIYQPNAKTE